MTVLSRLAPDELRHLQQHVCCGVSYFNHQVPLERVFQQGIAGLIADEGYDVRVEVPVPGGRADIVAAKGTTGVVIETKIRDPLPGTAQLYRYGKHLGGTLVLAVPDSVGSRFLRGSCEASGCHCWEVPFDHELVS